MKLGEYSTVREAADELGLEYKTLLKRIEHGSVKAERLGAKLLMIKRTEIARVKREHKPRRNPHRKHPLWPQYTGMLYRCYNPKSSSYKYYGGRGITVCDRWRNSFLDFIEDVGEPPFKKATLDRWPNNEGNYEPNNVRWATWQDQALNRRKKSSGAT